VKKNVHTTERREEVLIKLHLSPLLLLYYNKGLKPDLSERSTIGFSIERSGFNPFVPIKILEK